ncbi:MAG: hypothetical protein Q9160_008100 [Pyrenula sp. 1 TL-2023]
MAAQSTPPASPTPQTSSNLPPPAQNDPRFEMELEFVLSLSNPAYLSHLALTYPHLLTPKSESSARKSSSENTLGDSEADQFARYLAYLYAYWRTPEYSQYLTHPGATLRALELLQQDAFRRDVIMPGVTQALERIDDVAMDNQALAESGEAHGIQASPP